MAKQAYSVSLERDLVGLVDALAVGEGRSRSAMLERLVEKGLEGTQRVTFKNSVTGRETTVEGKAVNVVRERKAPKIPEEPVAAPKIVERVAKVPLEDTIEMVKKGLQIPQPGPEDVPKCPKCKRTGPVIQVAGGGHRCTRCNVVVGG